jgi:4-aminobutyrate aminotransferase/(S)-3-amino-2-methylpropionate transaminase
MVIADEIWTGMGRSGAVVRSTSVGAPADILCFGKGLGGGLPISACVAAEDLMMAWAQSPEVVHTSTHAGSPLACAAAIATMDALRFRKLPARAREVGEAARVAFAKELEGVPGVVTVRGEGLMLGIELDAGDRALRAMSGMLAKGYVVITGGMRSESLTLTPPLTIREERLFDAARALREVLTAP